MSINPSSLIIIAGRCIQLEQLEKLDKVNRKLQAKIKYTFSGKIWKHNTNGGWFFISLPKNISKEIRENLQWQEEGWGRMKASALANGLNWDTPIWFDKKHETYLLPLKADIRKKANIELEDEVTVSILI